MTSQPRTTGKQKAHLEPLIIACQCQMVFKSAFEYALLADLTLLARMKFTENDELHSNTPRILLFLLKSRQDMVRHERFVNRSRRTKPVPHPHQRAVRLASVYSP
ncbi:hypothetical protein AVEN_225557-1 [Araneus ventricosus]|uniref:Uncharacterized protein n=1 Tax=Araneus ventricosus TaxID=182803 RepID=A0A4Y2UTI6_ARAVE|nr:hypothetical protein AVEN_225557-1 [Araneus ventricosus]